MTRVVSSRERSEFILDPVEAWHRGRALDKMLAGARQSMPQGVLRASHRIFNDMDDRRQLDQARLLNGAGTGVT